MRQFIQLLHEAADGGVVNGWILCRPVVFVAETPHQDGGMVAVLIDQVGQHGACLLLPFFTHNAGATPRRLFPNQDAQLIAEVKHDARLLVMAEANEICAHRLDELQFLAELGVRLSGGYTGVVHMPLCAAQQHAFAIQFEGAVIDELRVPDAETFLRSALAKLCGERDAAFVEVRMGRGPERGTGSAERGNFRFVIPYGGRLCRLMNGLAVSVSYMK